MEESDCQEPVSEEKMDLAESFPTEEWLAEVRVAKRRLVVVTLYRADRLLPIRFL